MIVGGCGLTSRAFTTIWSKRASGPGWWSSPTSYWKKQTYNPKTKKLKILFEAMGIFKDMLKSDETLFKNAVALDYDYLPKLVPYREQEQFRIASCIKPLFQKRNGKNLIIHGKPGVGKTVACRHVLRELEDETEEIIPIYVNCWQNNTSFKIATEMCDALNYRLTHNKKTDELLDIVVKMLNRKSAVLVFDEIDKVGNYDFLYYLLEGVYRKCIILITNHREWFISLDDRIRSRLLPELFEFRPYDLKETKGILKQRTDAAFFPGVFEQDALELVAKKGHELQDVRTGLYLLRESANIAEENGSKKVNAECVNKAVSKLDDFKIKKSTDLDEESRKILAIVKENSGKKIGELFKLYQEQKGELVYKSFQRKIATLEKGRYISVDKVTGGKEGSTSIIKYSQMPKLTDF
ncbi:AAA family ATPase [Candidatus Woesearchaeota archaeon]|nr:AAA family ATPase [Candidatus Woesearchaeota archaeon]